MTGYLNDIQSLSFVNIKVKDRNTKLQTASFLILCLREEMSNMMKKIVNAILPTILILLILLSTNFYLYKVDVNSEMMDRQRRLEVVREMEWKLVTTLIEENRQKSLMQSKELATNIEKQLRQAYPDLDKLKYELDNNIPNTKFSEIIRANFTGVYLNGIENDNNDPWAALPWGINGDFSPNCSKFGDKRTWDIEYDMHANKKLAKAAVDEILIMSDKIIFWEFLPSENPKHKMITSMTLDALKEVFDSEGIEGLKTYEFLTPSYITRRGDIFGIPDIGSGGIKNENDKIIITQGFNLYDQIKKSHINNFKYLDERKSEIIRYYTTRLLIKDITVVTMSALMLLAIIALIFIYNKLYDLYILQNKKD